MQEWRPGESRLRAISGVACAGSLRPKALSVTPLYHSIRGSYVYLMLEYDVMDLLMMLVNVRHPYSTLWLTNIGLLW